MIPLCDHIPDWQPRIILLGMVEARSFNVKNTTTTTRSTSNRMAVSSLLTTTPTGTYIVVVFFTLTDPASTIPSNIIRGCQSGTTWSQRGTKVNRSHQGDNPLLRPTIQIATKNYATLQAMAPTNIKTVHQTSFTPYREQPRSTRIVVAYPRPAFSATNRTNTFQPVLINNKFQVSQGHTSYKNKEN